MQHNSFGWNLVFWCIQRSAREPHLEWSRPLSMALLLDMLLEVDALLLNVDALGRTWLVFHLDIFLRIIKHCIQCNLIGPWMVFLNTENMFWDLDWSRDGHVLHVMRSPRIVYGSLEHPVDLALDPSIKSCSLGVLNHQRVLGGLPGTCLDTWLLLDHFLADLCLSSLKILF